MMRGLILGVCFTFAVAKFELASTSDHLLDTLNGVKFSDTSHAGGAAQVQQKLVMDMVKTMGSMKVPLDTDHEAIVTQVLGLLQQILTELMAEKATDQGTLNAIENEIKSCVDNMPLDNINADKAYVDANKSSHQLCREQEIVAFQAYSDHCVKVADELHTHQAEKADRCLSHTTLSKHDTHPDTMSSWAAYFLGLHTWFYNMKDKLVTQLDPVSGKNMLQACDESQSDWTVKKSQCDVEQNVFEGHYCAWATAIVQRCTSIDTCYNQQMALHATVVAGINATSQDRVNTVATNNQLQTGVREIKKEEPIG
jgi:hypothetical protein